MTRQQGARLGFWGASYVLYAPYARRFEGVFRDVRGDLAKSGLMVTFHAYVAGALFTATVAGVAGALAGFTTAFYGGLPLGFMLLLPVGSGALAFAGCLAAFYFFPTTRARSRGRRLDAELPYAVGHMSVLATAGVTPERIFDVLAREEEGGVVAHESRMLVRDMATMGMDLSQAVEAEIRRSPSDRFGDFLDGFRSASVSGSDLTTYLGRAASAMMLDRRLQAKAVGENVGMVAEIYTIVLVVAPLLLLIMFSVMGAIVGSLGGLNVLTLMYLVGYLFVPFGGLVSLILADQTVRKEVD
ncbi:MAG: type II secretion system F family protein [Nitrososphaerota archaeon]|nr:type II secretion system F family protein [Nitrososphaerota archaeon]MDG7015011.1 type II secretion system F family protein [Nitrososphaerota archaeon]WGO50966.1 MAG: type II secretion system F family protein [Nitrososphaerota archaeon]